MRRLQLRLGRGAEHGQRTAVDMGFGAQRLVRGLERQVQVQRIGRRLPGGHVGKARGQARQLAFLIRQPAGIAQVGEQEERADQHRRQRRARQRPAPDPAPPLLGPRVELAQPGLGKDQVGEKPAQEERALFAMQPPLRRGGRKAQRLRDPRHHAVDGGSFLRGRAEIESAQPRRFLVSAFPEHRLDQHLDRPGQLVQLRGKAEHLGALVQRQVVGHPSDHAVLKRRLQRLHLALDTDPVHPVAGAQRRAPDLFALARVQIAEERLEPRHQIDLGDHQVDGQL